MSCPRPHLLAVAALALVGPVGASPRSIDLAATPAEATVFARNASPRGFFAARLAAPAPPADLSGDGVPDLIVSAWTGDGPPGSPRPDAGEVHVRFGPIAAGTTLDLATTPADIVVWGAAADDFLYAQAGADLSGDGVEDLILSAPRSNGAGGLRPNSGTVYVLFGPFASGTAIDLKTRNADVIVRGARAGDDLDARQPADVDGDGQLDLLLVAGLADGPGAARPDAGEAFVLRGPFTAGTVIDLSTASPLLRVTGADPGDALSWAVAADFDGDADTDLALGAYGSFGLGNAFPWAGEVHVLFGPLAGVRDLRTGSDLVILGEDTEDSLGGVLAAGDLDGDGTADLVAGACCTAGPGESRLYSGEAYAFFGPLAPGQRFSGQADVRVYGASDFDSLRYPAVARLGPDECLDLVLGADFASGPGETRPEAGEAHVLGGPFSRGQVIDLAAGGADLTVYGANGSGVGIFGDLLGIASAGDLTGDGRADLLLSAQFADGPGEARPDSGEVYLLEGGCRHLDAPPPQVRSSLERLDCLWPPNHRYACYARADFHPDITVACGAAYTWRLADCASDQGEGPGSGGPGKGDDCRVDAAGEEICVRAERSGRDDERDGRRYVIRVIATDACGVDGPPVVIGTIDVPHDEPPPGQCRPGTR